MREFMIRWTCERCGAVVEKRLSRLSLLVSVGRLSGWGRCNGLELCNSCVKKHEDGYKTFFTCFMDEAKKDDRKPLKATQKQG